MLTVDNTGELLGFFIDGLKLRKLLGEDIYLFLASARGSSRDRFLSLPPIDHLKSC